MTLIIVTDNTDNGYNTDNTDNGYNTDNADELSQANSTGAYHMDFKIFLSNVKLL